MLKNNPVGWFEIYVENMARAKAFYETVFDVQLEKIEDSGSGGPPVEMWAFPMDFETRGSPGALVKMEGFGPGNGGVLIYFSCADCAVEEKRAAAAGGRVERSKYSIGQYGFISMVVDTEGNMIGLHTAASEM